jgi:hypothetical protein
MTAEESHLFETLDKYSRTHHKCFLAEMCLAKNATEYVFCFRPAHARSDSPVCYACRYLRLAVADSRAIAQARALIPEAKEIVDRELKSLNDSLHQA